MIQKWKHEPPLQFQFQSACVHCLCVWREPDSTYFELPPGSQPGERSVPSTSTPSHRSAAEVSMDVYHMRDINDNVMVRTQTPSMFQFLSLWSALERLQLVSVLKAYFRSSGFSVRTTQTHTHKSVLLHVHTFPLFPFWCFPSFHFFPPVLRKFPPM